MKCEYCGGNLSLETLQCPHCGAPNKHARQHVEDMNRYRGAFENTREDVYTLTRNYAGIAIRGGVIVALLAAVIGLLFLVDNSYSMQRNYLMSRAEKRYEEYSATMEAYLEVDDYMGFYSFCRKEGIEGYTGSYESYAPILRLTTCYKYLYDAIMEYHAGKQNPEVEEYTREINIDYLIMQMENFYDGLDMKEYKYYKGADSEKNAAVMERMEECVRALLYTYCGLTEEEFEQWEDLSTARKVVVLEESLQNAE